MNKLLKNSKILQNVSWLFVLQIFNTIIPMLTLPYITRILQPTKYGDFSAALNIITYLQVIVEFGFELNGARKVALIENNSDMSKIFNEIFFSRILLFFLSLFILISLTALGYFNKTTFACSIILLIMVIGTIIQPNWIFQGKEDMKFITYTNVIGRLISITLIFMFVNDSNDIFIYCILYSLNIFVSNLIGFILALKKYKIIISIPHLSKIINALKNSWYLFISSAMGKVFSNLGITVLTAFTTSYYVGIYAAIQKIPNILILLFTPIGQAIFPYTSKKFNSSYIEGFNFVKKVCIIVIIPFIILGILIICLQKMIVSILFGNEYVAYSTLIIPLCIWLILSILNNFLGIQMLVGAGHQKEYSKAFQFSLIVIILSNFILGKFIGLYGVAWATMISELSLSIILLLYNWKIINKNLT